MMLLIKSKQHVSKDNISRIKLTPVNSADEDQVELLEKVNVVNIFFSHIFGILKYFFVNDYL